MWHQTLLTFVQTYRYHLSEEQRTRLKSLLKIQQHHTITAEIRRELFLVQAKPSYDLSGVGKDADMIAEDSD